MHLCGPIASRNKKNNIKPEYCLELQSVNSVELDSVMANEFGQVLQRVRVETVIVDND